MGKVFVLVAFLAGVSFSLPKESFENLNKMIVDSKTFEADSLIEMGPKKDPEIVLLRLNSTFKKGRQNKVIIAQGEAQEGDLLLSKNDDPKVKGFIREEIIIDSSILIAGFDQFEQDLNSHANRINLHTCYLKYLLAVKFYGRIDSGLAFFMETSINIRNEWHTLYGEKVNASEEAFLLEYQSILGDLFRIESKAADRLIVKHGEKAIKKYPKSKYAYNILGSLHGANRDYEKALKYLKSGYEIDKKDKTIIGNIVEMYKRSGDNKNHDLWKEKL